MATFSGPAGATFGFQKTLKFVRFLYVFWEGGGPGVAPGRHPALPGRPGRVWAPPGWLPGYAWGFLGGPCRVPGSSWGAPGCLGGLPGTSWARPGPAGVVQAGPRRARVLPGRCPGPSLATLSGPAGATFGFQKTLKFVRFLYVFWEGGGPGDAPGHQPALLAEPGSMCGRPVGLLGGAGGFWDGS